MVQAYPASHALAVTQDREEARQLETRVNRKQPRFSKAFLETSHSLETSLGPLRTVSV